MDTITSTEKQSLEQELSDLQKKRDAYAGKITHLAIQIAVLFAIPLLVALGIHYAADVSFPSLMPFAFILSWIGVVYVYRKIDKEVRTLELRIYEIKQTLTTTERL